LEPRAVVKFVVDVLVGFVIVALVFGGRLDFGTSFIFYASLISCTSFVSRVILVPGAIYMFIVGFIFGAGIILGASFISRASIIPGTRHVSGSGIIVTLSFVFSVGAVISRGSLGRSNIFRVLALDIVRHANSFLVFRYIGYNSEVCLILVDDLGEGCILVFFVATYLLLKAGDITNDNKCVACTRYYNRQSLYLL